MMILLGCLLAIAEAVPATKISGKFQIAGFSFGGNFSLNQSPNERQIVQSFGAMPIGNQQNGGGGNNGAYNGDAFNPGDVPDLEGATCIIAESSEEELMAMEQDEPAAGSESVPVAAAQSTPAAAPISAPAPNQTLVEQSDSEAERAALLENMGDTG